MIIQGNALNLTLKDGTVGVVAQKHGRSFIGIELNPEYVKLAEQRLLAAPQSLFNQSVLQETP